MRTPVILFVCTVVGAGCFDFTATVEGDIGEACGDVDHYCASDLACEGRVCLRPGGSFLGERCGPRIPCGQQLACENERCMDPCANDPCNGHGSCAVSENAAVCDCFDGFVAEVGSCFGESGSPCSETSPCGSGLVCYLGFCAAQCSGTLCQSGSVCDSGQTPPICVCPIGTREDGERCVSRCFLNDCGGHGTCAVLGDDVVCTCDEPYESKGATCGVRNCVPTSHARPGCFNGDAYWFNSCDDVEELLEDCGARACAGGSCAPVDWVQRDVTFAGIAIGSADFAVLSTGQIAVATSQSNTPGLRFKRWDTVNWTDFDANGGAYPTGSWNASVRTLAIGPGDRIALAYSAQSVNYIEWNNAWVERGSSSTTGVHSTTAFAESLALDSYGAPHIVFAIPGYFERDIMYRRYEGGVWGGIHGSDTGNGLSGLGISTNGAVALTSANEPVVTWLAGPSPFRIVAKQHSTSGWSTIADMEIDTNSLYQQPGLAALGNSVALTWINAGQVHARVWDGSSSDSTVATRQPSYSSFCDSSVAFDAQGRPVVAWCERSSDNVTYAIYVRRRVDGSWVPVGSKSSAGRGLAEGYFGVPQQVRMKINNSRACVGWIPASSQQTYALQCAAL